jgi:hypothetical protein
MTVPFTESIAKTVHSGLGFGLVVPDFSQIKDIDGACTCICHAATQRLMPRLAHPVPKFYQFRPRLDGSATYFEQLLSLSTTGTTGISSDCLVDLFSQCSKCLLLVARGAIERHECPDSCEAIRLAGSCDPFTWIGRLESCEGAGSGITVGAFRCIFVECTACLRFVMKAKFTSHQCGL